MADDEDAMARALAIDLMERSRIIDLREQTNKAAKLFEGLTEPECERMLALLFPDDPRMQSPPMRRFDLGRAWIPGSPKS